ncbi:hypothetical protein SHIRM173S_13333 [Streptomyces hirsutus]
MKNAALVGDMGRQALTELREMLGVLRQRWGRVRGRRRAAVPFGGGGCGGCSGGVAGRWTRPTGPG